MFLESQENGLVSFLVADGAGGGGWDPWCDCGGGAHGTEGSTPESPCSDGFAFLGGGTGFEFSVDDSVNLIPQPMRIDVGLYLSTNLVSRGSHPHQD